ncbi:hypothetical protein [Paracoccus jiaweipingae]|uniref:hypothetical protein n=1 Tax=unclassified Paracoccus (in: a-proteobacteria) TaxID=2688777 RepID=UPI0037B7A6F5
MSRLFFLLLTLSMSTLAGIGVVVALAMGYYTTKGVVVSALIGAIISIPITWLVEKKMTENDMMDPDE